MSTSLSFSQTFRYADDETGITIPVVLGAGRNVVSATAKVDTGAEVCLFDRVYGERLKLEVEQGTPMLLQTLTGSLECFGHEITIQSVGLAFYTLVYFSKHSGLPRNLLGRNGWLRNLRLGLIDYENQLLLSPYDEF